jgi:hypothetical protein
VGHRGPIARRQGETAPFREPARRGIIEAEAAVGLNVDLIVTDADELAVRQGCAPGVVLRRIEGRAGGRWVVGGDEYSPPPHPSPPGYPPGWHLVSRVVPEEEPVVHEAGRRAVRAAKALSKGGRRCWVLSHCDKAATDFALHAADGVLVWAESVDDAGLHFRWEEGHTNPTTEAGPEERRLVSARAIEELSGGTLRDVEELVRRVA